MIDVSIVIVNWNTKDMLANCIDSINKETTSIQIEIIVVDNNSSDGSQEVVRKKYHDVVLIANTENLGFSKANNIGIKRARGKYICLLNSDTIILEHAIDQMYAFMEENVRTGILGPAILNEDLSTRQTCRIFPTLHTELNWALRLDKIFPGLKFFSLDLMVYFKHDKTSAVDVVPGSCMFIKKEAIDAAGMLDELFFFYAEDVDICKRFKNKGWEVIYFPQARVIHFGGISTAKAPLRFARQLLIANIQYWRKHYALPKVIGYLMIKLLHYSIRFFGFILLFMMKKNERKENYDQIIVNKECIKYILTGINK